MTSYYYLTRIYGQRGGGGERRMLRNLYIGFFPSIVMYTALFWS